MPIAAINTHYAGCHFRSRLEARWAVFFDHLNITWEYEPQGYEFDGQRYLPDFHLPTMGIDVEVKGVMDEASAGKVTRFAHHGKTILVLGDIPRPGASGPHHWLIDQWRGAVVLEAVSWLPAARADQTGAPTSKATWFVFPLGRAMEIDGKPDGDVAAVTGSPPPATWVRTPDKVSAGYRAARSARFEHGETPISRPRAIPREPISMQPLDLDLGDRVQHDTYGQGVVIHTDGVGPRSTVTVKFRHGTVRLMLIGGIPMRKVAS